MTCRCRSAKTARSGLEDSSADTAGNSLPCDERTRGSAPSSSDTEAHLHTPQCTRVPRRASPTAAGHKSALGRPPRTPTNSASGRSGAGPADGAVTLPQGVRPRQHSRRLQGRTSLSSISRVLAVVPRYSRSLKGSPFGRDDTRSVFGRLERAERVAQPAEGGRFSFLPRQSASIRAMVVG